MTKAGVGAAAVVLLAVLIFFAVSAWSRQPALAKASAQPIAFPHNTHVQTYKIDCQYCHADARRSEYAGPAVGGALHGLPQDRRGRQAGDQEAGGVRRPSASRFPWARVYKLPEFTYFPHKAHLRAEVACQTCHGPVRR
jgi:hypothetical protein